MFTLHNPTKTDDCSAYTVTSLPCPYCKETISIEIWPEKLYAYNHGAYAQTVLSQYGPDVRERFISGTCGPCWSELFGDWEDE